MLEKKRYPDLAKDGDEGKAKEDEPTSSAVSFMFFMLFECTSQLHAYRLVSSSRFDERQRMLTPFSPGAVELEHSEAHDEDDERRDEVEDALPEFFRLGPETGRLREPDGNEGSADGKGAEEAEAGA